MAALKELREQIDAIDADLVRLLNRRAELALEVKKAKEKDRLDIYAPDRERQILDRVLKLAAGGPFPGAPLERIFINIISVSRSLIGGLSVAYPGPEYSLEHEAALQQFGEAVSYTPEPNIDGVFTKVERGDALYGVLPAQMSTSGSVGKTFARLMQSDLVIIAEVEVKESFALFSRSRAFSDIERLYAPAYCYERCEKWISANLPGAEVMLQSHLGSALKQLEVAPGAGLLVSRAFGDRLSLPALAAGIQDPVEADPRFVIIGQKATSPTGRDKTSIAFSLKDRAGALRDVLRPFADRGITLLRIESRRMTNAWEYVFFADFAGHQSEPAAADAIRELQDMSVYLRVLGSYPLVVSS